MERETIIKRESDIYRPLYLSNRKVDRIIFHNGTEILLTMQQGWIETHERLEDRWSSGCDVVAILGREVRNARKVDLSKKDDFTASYSDKDKGFYESGIALYLYVPEVKDLGIEESEPSTIGSISRRRYTEIPLSVLARKLHLNEDQSDERKRYVYKDVPMESVIVSKFLPDLHTDDYKRREALSEKIKEQTGIELSNRDLMKLEEHYTIAAKG
jgi:hypothetical protein